MMTLEQYIDLIRKLRGDEFMKKFNWDNVKFQGIIEDLIGLKCTKHNIDIIIKAQALKYNNNCCSLCHKEFVNKVILNRNEVKLDNIKTKFLQKYGNDAFDNIDWNNAVYINKDTPISNIRCKKHNEPILRPPRIFCAHEVCGCLKCNKEFQYNRDALTLDQFKQRYVDIHGIEKFNTLDWSQAEYLNLNKPIKNLRCIIHNQPIIKAAKDLFDASGCKLCSIVWKMQDKWMDSLGLPNDNEHRQVKIILNDGIRSEFLMVDGFDITTNTVYEFWGDYHHGNPKKHPPNEIHQLNGKTMGELYEKTLEKRRRIFQAGYTLLEIWESDWNAQCGVKPKKYTPRYFKI